jgi:L-ribulose-5-phosphate 4-epimerase
MFAQKQKPIPCLGTTHADLAGDIPVTRMLSPEEIQEAYEHHTGVAICEILENGFQPCVLVASHGPFTFGKTAKEAVNHAQILEKIATMAMLGTRRNPLDPALFEKHYKRKHGDTRYYGQ